MSRDAQRTPDSAPNTPPGTGPDPSPAAVPRAGSTPLRVRYCECDPMGVAHHAAYVPWLEVGRTELLRGAGVSYAQLEAAGVFLVVTRLELRYRAPARYDDTLLLDTIVAGGTRVRIDHTYELWRHTDDGRGRTELLLSGSSTLACVDRSGRPRALPDWLAPRDRPPRARS